MFRQKCPCPCFGREEEEVRVLDYRHSSLDQVPAEVFNFERTLEELYVDANNIKDLPRELFYCHGLRVLSLSDNELVSIPPAIASLLHLTHLDVSKNGIVDLPDNIKGCKYLTSIEASVNPIGKLPEGFTQLLNLTELYLNDTFLDYLPGSFGRLSKLKILECRENHLKTLPKSLSRLTYLERLDIGNNDFTELPEVVGSLTGLLELWCDCNRITTFPSGIGNLKQLMFLDASKNRIETLPAEIDGCISLADLHLSTNLLQQLPENIGRLSSLTTLKVDDNRLTSLPVSIGGLASLSEMNISANDLEELPPSIGFLRHLRTLYADENFLYDIPPELGSCNGLTVLSVRSNNLLYIPDEIGRIPRLRVLNLSDNKIRCLPYSLTRLKELQALWLAENQTKPLIQLQPDIDIDTGQRMLTCYLLPQMPEDREDLYSDAGSFHPSLWEEERRAKQRIHFDFDEEEVDEGKLERQPTPYPKEMKHRIQHMRNLALKQLGIPGAKSPGAVVGRRDQSAEGEAALGATAAEDGPSTSVLLSDNPSEAKVKHPSPLLRERHLLFKADKEKLQKDKARMSHSREDVSAATTRQVDGEAVESNTTARNLGRSAEKLSNRDSAVSAAAGRDEDDGGFLNTSTRSASSRPGSQHQEPTATALQASAAAAYLQDPSVSSTSGSQTRTTANQGATANLPAHHPIMSTDPVNRSLNSLSYTEFTRGLLSVTKNPPLPVSTGDNMNLRLSGSGYIPSSFYLDHHNAKQQGAVPKGRRNGGYESDAGYKSDTHIYRRRKPQYNADGYASDWEAVQRHHMSQKYLQRDGYASDSEHRRLGSAGAQNYNLVHPPFRPHSSYQSSQHSVAYSNSASQRSIASQRSSSHHSVASSQNLRLPSHGPGRLSVQSYPPAPNNNARQLTGGYTNVPSTKRTMLRNDEMYEIYPGANKDQRQDSSKRNAAHHLQSYSKQSVSASNNSVAQHTNPRQSNPNLVNVQHTPPAVRQPSSQVNTPQRNSNMNSPGDKSTVWATPVSEEKSKENNSGGSSTEDEIWRAQLYQASIKLQKTPSEKRKSRKSAPSPGGSDEVAAPVQPPPYQPAPPYSQTRTSRQPGTPHGSGPSLNRSQAPTPTSSTTNHQYSTPQRDQSFSGRSGALRPKTLPLGTPPGSPGPPPRPKDAYYHTPQRNNKTLQDSPSRPLSSLQRTPSGDNPRGDSDTLGGGSCPSRHSNSASKPLHVQVDGVGVARVDGTPAGAASSSAAAAPHPPPRFSPLKVTQYDKDVAVYKGPEPPSQVSSSTDSGYGHAHIYEKMSADTSSSLSNSRTVLSPSSTQLQHKSSPGRDSALGSRESTPGSVNMSTQPRPAPEGQRNSDGCIDDSQLRVMEVTIVKNPGLGFSIAGGLGSPGNPFREDDVGIFVTKVSAGGAAENRLLCGDKILKVNGVDFNQIDHKEAVKVLRSSGPSVSVFIERNLS